MDPASAELLERAREYICGCGTPSDEPCDCDVCIEAMTLLGEIEIALANAAIGNT